MPRTVAVVVDPIQSVRGKVVINAFRTYGSGLELGFLGGGSCNEQRQSTSKKKKRIFDYTIS